MSEDCKNALWAIRKQFGDFDYFQSLKELNRIKRTVDEPERRKPLSPSKRLKLYADQQGKCGECGDTYSIKQMHDDHIIALAQGGTNDLRNRRLICAGCNREKSSKSLMQLSKESGKTILEQLQ